MFQNVPKGDAIFMKVLSDFIFFSYSFPNKFLLVYINLFIFFLRLKLISPLSTEIHACN